MAAQHTPGPWYWIVNPANHSFSLESSHKCRTTVFDVVRWGMQSAQLRFNQGNIMEPATQFGKPIPGREHHKSWALNIDHPDARLIAAAPEMYDLLEAILSDWEEDWQGSEPRELCDLELQLQELVTRLNPHRNQPQPDSEPDYNLNPGPF